MNTRLSTKARQLMSLTVIALTLTGCAAGLDGEFACDKVGGINGCTNMAEVRELIDTGAFNQPTSTGTAVTHALPPMPGQTPMDFTPLPRRDRNGFPLRTSEVIQKITVFPFINEGGNYVDTTDVYIVLDKSRWTGRPAHLIKKD